MLHTLRIQNLAIIDEAEIPFEEGLNILSGETGAGKSIVIEAISLLLGSRANADLIRKGKDELVVEGLFDVTEMPFVRDRLKKAGFSDDRSELLIKRMVSRAGKHRIYINGELATLSLLQTVNEGLVDLCGQNEHQSLLKPTTQTDLLDRYGGVEKTRARYEEEFCNLRSLRKARAALIQAEEDRSRRLDFIEFQINEIASAELSPGEDTALAEEKKLLQSAEQRRAAAASVLEALDPETSDGDSGALPTLRAALSKIRPLGQADSKTVAIAESLERALAEAEDAHLQLSKYLRTIESDSNRLGQVSDRLSLIAELKKKYAAGGSVSDVLTLREKLESERESLSALFERIEELDEKIAASEKTLSDAAKKLHISRVSSAKVLSESVTAELKELKMGEAELAIVVQFKDDESEWTQLGPDTVQFVIQTNRGENALPLAKIASGGELSRVMLAIRRVISDKGTIGVYLFDEIDAGIGGQTAFQVGRKLKSVARYNQVICITHVPQVASFADHHLSVQKSTSRDRTTTEIIVLDDQARKEELARMLGGAKLSSKTLANAAELLEMAAGT